MLNSSYQSLGEITLPDFSNRQYYMHGFDLANPHMPEGFEDYLEPVIELCRKAGQFIGKAYVTVDEKVVKAGQTQRRPGPHVDGCYLEHMRHWGHGGWNHSCNAIPERMSVIVAASVSGCKVWGGSFDAIPTDSGDLSHISDQLGLGEVLPPNTGYLLSPDCIHESLPFEKDTQRTFLRIALPTIGE